MLDVYNEFGTDDILLFRNSTKNNKLSENGIYYDKESNLYYARNTHMIDLLNDEYDYDYNKESLPIKLAAEGLIVTKDNKKRRQRANLQETRVQQQAADNLRKQGTKFRRIFE